MPQVILESENMARPPSGKPERQYFRRSPDWCDEMTALVEQCAHIVKSQRLYFPYGIGKTLVNSSGIVQGTLEMMAEDLSSVKKKQWEKYLNGYAGMDFEDKRKGLHFEERAYDAFKKIGQALERRQMPEGVNLVWKGEYHYALIIAVALMWFVDTH